MTSPAIWDSAAHPRDTTSGRFDRKHHSAPDASLDDLGEMAGFMLEPPTPEDTAIRFGDLVEVSHADGTATRGWVVGIDDDAVMVEGDWDEVNAGDEIPHWVGGARWFERRYVGVTAEDESVVLAQRRALAAAEEMVGRLQAMSPAHRDAFERHSDYRQFQDDMFADGHNNHDRDYERARNAVLDAPETLHIDGRLSHSAAAWVETDDLTPFGNFSSNLNDGNDREFTAMVASELIAPYIDHTTVTGYQLATVRGRFEESEKLAYAERNAAGNLVQLEARVSGLSSAVRNDADSALEELDEPTRAKYENAAVHANRFVDALADRELLEPAVAEWVQTESDRPRVIHLAGLAAVLRAYAEVAEVDESMLGDLESVLPRA